MDRNISESIATGWTAGVRFEEDIFLFSSQSIQIREPNQPPMQWVLVDLSPDLKLPDHEVHHSHPSIVTTGL
jgi:hypothetical protein